MLKWFPLVPAAALLALGGPAQADTILLKDKASVTGKILAEKRDQIAVDVGYTVLVIPRNHVQKIQRGERQALPSDPTPEVPQSLPTASATAPDPKLYSTSGTGGETSGNVRELVNLLGEGVVQVRTPASIGSGFILNEEGFLITNFHVIEGETQISVEVYHQKNGQLEPRSYRQVRIIAMNKFADLALLKIDEKDASKFKYVTLGRAEAMAVGERVFAVGSPLGLERTVTEGILSTKTRQLGGELYLQTTAQINPGNSGGPLFNLNGEVVGVTNMKITFGEGLGFAIPSEAVKHFLDNRDAFAYSNDNPGNAYRYLEPPTRVRDAKTVEPKVD
jgi:serine protease Do